MLQVLREDVVGRLTAGMSPELLCLSTKEKSSLTQILTSLCSNSEFKKKSQIFKWKTNAYVYVFLIVLQENVFY